MARTASRRHIDLVVLLALQDRPADGHTVIERLRAHGDGVLRDPERTVHRTLHRLARNRLVVRRVDRRTGRRRYTLTATGDRVTRTRLREWRELSRFVDAVAGSSGTS